MVRGGKRRVAAVLLGVALIALGCSDSPTSPADAEQGPDSSAALQAVYDQLEGLGPEERREELIRLAEEEGGDFTLYGSTNLDEADPIISAFEDATGLEPSLYRASSTDLAQRILQEADAGYAGADLVYTNGPEMAVLDDAGLLLPLESPAAENLVQEAIVSDNWLPIYLNLFVAAWNTDRVPAGQEPATWQEVFSGFQGNLAMEVGDYDWFMTLVSQYFVGEQEMSEEEAVELFRQAARGASMIDGHTLMTELLAGGEFDAATSVYKHRVDQLKRDGAPVDWQPAVQPLVIRPNGIGILKTTEHPAAALLFAEFMLTDVQQMLLEFDRTPADVNAPGGGIPQDVEVLVADLEQLFQENDKWEELYEEIAGESGGEVIED